MRVKRGVKVVVRLDRSYDYQDAAGAEQLSQKMIMHVKAFGRWYRIVNFTIPNKPFMIN